MSKHPPSTPARLGVVVPGAVRPRGAPSPPRQRAATQERVQFPAYSHLSGRRGAAERQRGTTPGGGVVVRGGGAPRGSCAPAESGKLAQPTAFPFQRNQGPAAPPSFPERWVRPPGTHSLWAWARIRLLPVAEAGRADRARPLLAVPLTSGPGRGATPPVAWVASLPSPIAAICRGLWARPPGIPTGPPGRAAVKPLQACPPAPSDRLNKNTPTG